MTRFSGALIVVAFASASGVAGQDAEPRFDVASVRPSVDALAAPSARLVGGRFEARGVTAGQLIGNAYAQRERPLAPGQLANGPSWIGYTRFDIQVISSETLS